MMALRTRNQDDALIIFLIYMSISIITLNVQGFRSAEKQLTVVQWARAQNCDLLVLQETNFKQYSDVVSFKLKFQVECYFSFGTARNEGVAIINFHPGRIRDIVVKFDVNGRVIAWDMTACGQRMRGINVYAPARSSDCNPFFKDLDSFMLGANCLLVVGDFNCVLDTQRDIRGPGQGRVNYESRELRRIIAQYDLQDAWLYVHGNRFQYTWARRRSLSRLDRLYFQNGREVTAVACEVVRFPQGTGYVSDHLPLSVKLSVRSAQRAQCWRLNNCLLREEAIMKEMEKK